MKNHGSKG